MCFNVFQHFEISGGLWGLTGMEMGLVNELIKPAACTHPFYTFLYKTQLVQNVQRFMEELVWPAGSGCAEICLQHLGP
jgi:hypothetical protein